MQKDKKNKNLTLRNSNFLEVFHKCCDKHNVSRETLGDFIIYHDLLVEWQSKLNLVSQNSLDELWDRHFADSLQLLLYIDDLQTGWLDLGSGAGFPGAVLSIFLKDKTNIKFSLVESNAKKCAYLRELKIKTGANYDIINERIEDVDAKNIVKPINYITARALTSLDNLFEYCKLFTDKKTMLILQKGKDVDSEVGEACKNWKFVYTIKQSKICENSYIVLVNELESKEI